MTNSTANPVSRVDLFSILDAYTKSHDDADSDLKSCWWNLNKARRQKGGFQVGGGEVYSAADIREELRARALLLCSNGGAPTLIDEDERVKTFASVVEDVDVFTLHLDGIPKQQDAVDTGDSQGVKRSTDTGLRQRKNAPSESSGNEWTEEMLDDSLNDEEKRLREVNPLDLFGGLPPPALKIAQTKAREALAAYVEAANLAAAIFEMTRDNLPEQKTSQLEVTAGS